MDSLEKFYNQRPDGSSQQEFLTQVAHTESGQPVSDAQFESMLGQIRELLGLTPSDQLLDLCCGNGLITNALAEHVERAKGIDFSHQLLSVAHQHHSMPNLCFQWGNLLRPNDIPPDQTRYTKVLMYAALQHFGHDDLGSLLEFILSVSAERVTILFGFVPDRERRPVLYDTPVKKIRNWSRRLLGRELIKSWWTREEFLEACAPRGLICSFHSLPANLLASGYRFNVRIEG
ncbi:MAG: class I SAM-dependent methyltransferase [Xanthomonadales bacterium]|nr:class I SAM-dependent methyltransferase [Xanthomonadales bacterium]